MLSNAALAAACLLVISCGGEDEGNATAPSSSASSNASPTSSSTSINDMAACAPFFAAAGGTYVGRVIDVRGVAGEYFELNESYPISISTPAITVERTKLGDLEHDFSVDSFTSCRTSNISRASWAGSGREERMLTIMYFEAERTFTQFVISFPGDESRAAIEISSAD